MAARGQINKLKSEADDNSYKYKKHVTDLQMEMTKLKTTTDKDRDHLIAQIKGRKHHSNSTRNQNVANVKYKTKITDYMIGLK